MSTRNMDELVEIIENGPQFKKVQAVQDLAKCTDAKFLELFRKNLRHKDWHIRVECAKAIAKINGKDAVEELTPLLEDRAFGVREDVKKLIEELKK